MPDFIKCPNYKLHLMISIVIQIFAIAIKVIYVIYHDNSNVANERPKARNNLFIHAISVMHHRLLN